MALKIPPDFDVYTQNLDANETFIRDGLRLDISNWAKFRHTIDTANEASKLRSLGGTIPDEVKDAYRELAKSHYEVILSLGQAKLSVLLALSVDVIPIEDAGRLLTFMKSLKDCYFHLGCLLDNLARLIYILNDSQSPTATVGSNNRLKYRRHGMDWGRLADRMTKDPLLYRGYHRFFESQHLQEIVNIRNAATHDWLCPISVDTNGVPSWPLAIRKKRHFYWFYDELPSFRRIYRKWVPIEVMLQQDLDFMTRFQNKVFARLRSDVTKFEHFHNLEIT